jgi:5'-nucleotidase
MGIGAVLTRGIVPFALLGAVAIGPGCSSGDAKPNDVCPPGQTCQVRLTVLHTSDIHSRLLPYDLLITQIDGDLGLGTTGTTSNVGGVARMAYILGRERARADRVVHLDSGDCFQGAPIFNFYSGEPEVRSLSLLGVDAAVIGNHEFDRGTVNVATQMQRWASFALLGANYKFNAPGRPDDTGLGNIVKPFHVFNRDGLRIGVIGMGNLSSLTSIFDQPNRQGIQPLNTVETAQFYIDLLRPHVDVIAFTTHMGLEVDQRMIRNTTGIDVVMGGHNHVVISPPQQVQDCSADIQNPGFIWAVDPNLDVNPDKPPPQDELHPDPINHPYMFKRPCKPRKVVLAHSGAFTKFVGRLDLVLSNNPAEVSPTGDPADYDPVNRFEVVSNKYAAFPITEQVPEDPIIVEMLQPYRRTLDRVADLDLLVGYSPFGARRFGTQGGDSPLGNLVSTAMWLRLGIQTDFSMTNSTGIRQDLLPGPITFEQMYNIFPFDNSITKMQLSGSEVQEMFDFIARRTAGRGCAAQAQIAGARVRINCTGCSRPDAAQPCRSDEECIGGTKGSCQNGICNINACAEQVYIGHSDRRCANDADCGGLPGQCDRSSGQAEGLCQTLISKTNLYELATSNYLAGGGSGFRVLQRNTTQFDTKIQQRDALIDYLRQGRPCGYDPNAGTREGLRACAADADCPADFVCACPGHAVEDSQGGVSTCRTDGACDPSIGRCVRNDCRNQIANFHNRLCAASPFRDACRGDLKACVIAGEECKLLSCVDENLGARIDNRIEVLGR